MESGVQSSSGRSIGTATLALLAIALFLIINIVGLHSVLTSRRQLQVWDFQPLWQAGRWLMEGRGSPYSPQMTYLLQLQSYGRPAASGEDPHTFAYPLYALAFVLPLSYLPLPWAQAVWFTLLELSAASAILVSARMAGWRLSVLAAVAVVTGGFLQYSVTWALLLGQISLLVFALVPASVLSLALGRDALAGIFLALATVKPQMSFLLVPALLFWSVCRRRYRFGIWFTVTLASLFVTSFLVLPSWVHDFTEAMVGYFSDRPLLSPVALMARMVGGSRGNIVGAILTLALMAGLILVWWGDRRQPSVPLEAVGFTLVVTTLIAPRTSVANQTTLILSLLIVSRAAWIRGPTGRALSGALVLLALAGIWVARAFISAEVMSSYPYAEHVVLSPILPLLLLACYVILFMRDGWGICDSRKSGIGGKEVVCSNERYRI